MLLEILVHEAEKNIKMLRSEGEAPCSKELKAAKGLAVETDSYKKCGQIVTG